MYTTVWSGVGRWTCWEVGVAALGGMAHVPMLAWHLWRLGQHPAYGCMPLGLLIILIGLYRCRATYSFPRGPWCWGVLWSAAWVQCVSVLLCSPWLSAASGVLAGGTIIWSDTDRRRSSQLCQLWTLGWLILPLPLEWDTDLARWLQQLASQVASRMLDLLGVNHCRLGAIIEVPDYRFVVEAGCSGMNSLYAIVLLTGLYACWRQVHGARFCGLLLMALYWALAINALRITVLVACHNWWQWDTWDRGWHGAVGLFVVSLVMGLVVSTNALMRFAGPMSQDVNLAPNPDTAGHCLGLPDGHADAARPVLQRRHRTQLPVLLIAVPFGLSIGLQCTGGLTNRLWNNPEPAAATSQRVRALSADAVECPADSGWILTGFRGANTQSNGAPYRPHCTWSYRFAGGTAAFRIDDQPEGPHDLVKCYRAQGWRCSERQRVSCDGSRWGRVTEAVLCRPGRAPAVLFFAQVSAEAIRSGSHEVHSSAGLSFVDRLRSRWDRGRRTPLIQLQLFIQLKHHIDRRQRVMLRQRFSDLMSQAIGRMPWNDSRSGSEVEGSVL